MFSISIEQRRRIAQTGVLLLLATAAAIAYLTRHCLAVANTSIQNEIGCNNEQFGYLYGAFSLGYLIFQVPGGWVGQKLGTRSALPLFAILWSLMTLLTALVTTLVALVAIRFLFGLAQGGLVPNQAKVLRDWIPDSSRGIASSVLMLGMSVGGVASMSLTSSLMRNFDWRTIFVAYACVGFLFSIAFFALFRSTPDEIGWLKQNEVESNDLVKRQISAAAPIDKISLSQILVRRSIWGLIGMALFKAAGYNLLVTFLPVLLQYAYDVPQQQTGGLVSWSMAAVIGGSMSGGWLIDHVQRLTSSKRLSRAGVGAAALILAALFTGVAGFTDTSTTLSAYLAAASFFSGVASASPWVAVIDIGGRNTGVVMGLMNSSSALAGVAISPLVGRLVDVTRAASGNWSLVIWLHAIFYLVAAIFWIAVNPDRPLEPLGDRNAV